MSNILEYNRSITIRNANPELTKSGLATHVLSAGLLCGNHCLWCPNPGLMRTQEYFKTLGMSSYEAFQNELVIIDPNTPDRLLVDLPELGLTNQNTVLLGRSFDLWSPEAVQYNLGRKCLKVILAGSNCRIRIVTKSAAVAKDFDLIAKFNDRIELSLTIPAPLSKSNLINVLEPKASPLPDRIDVLDEANQKGIKIYGMISPCVPGLVDTKEELGDIFDLLLPLDPTGLWVETLNLRKVNTSNCIQALTDNGFYKANNLLSKTKNSSSYRNYRLSLIDNLITIGNELSCMDLLRCIMPIKGIGYYYNQYQFYKSVGGI